MAIDGTKIIHAVMEGSQIRESKGIIPLFGVYLSFFPSVTTIHSALTLSRSSAKMTRQRPF